MNHNIKKFVKLARWWLAFCLLGWGSFAPVLAAECSTASLSALITNLADTNCDSIKLTGTITISTAETLNGNGKTISGNDTFRLFLVSNANGEVVFNDLTLQNGTQIKTNTSSHGCSDSFSNGGAICKEGAGTLTINRSTIKGNMANRGGGIYVAHASGGVELNSTVLMTNTASVTGGGLYKYTESGLDATNIVKFVGCTITDNEASNTSNTGSGVFNIRSTMRIKNSVIIANRKGSFSIRDCQNSSGDMSSEGYNIFGSGTGCPTNDSTDQFKSTTEVDTIFSTKPLLQTTDISSNPAINKIDKDVNDCKSNTVFSTDYLSIPRPQGSKCDIGAYEVPLPTILIEVDGSEVASGDTFDLGSVGVGGSASITLNITNTGAADLTFSNISGLPAGFTTIDSLNTLTSGATTTYSISLNTSVVNNYSGSFSFETNDTNFSFNLTGAVVDTSSAPDDPSDFTATTASDTSIDLSWTDNSDNESNFILTWTPDGDSEHSEDANDESTTITGLICETDYEFTLYAYNGSYSNPVVASATTDTCPPPSDPSGLTVDSTTETSANLSWADNSTSETGFILERKTGAEAFSEVATLTVNTTSMTDTSLSCNTSYVYRLKATNNGIDSAYTSEVSTTTAACPAAPNAPTNLVVASTSSTSANLTWTDNSGDETAFILERKTGTSVFSEVAMLTADSTNTTDSGLTCNMSYTYRLKATNSGSDSSYTSEVIATTATCVTVPNAPSNLTIIDTSASSADLTWTDNSNDENSFVLERKVGSSGSYSQVATLGNNVTSTTNTGLSCSTEYYYRLKAVGDGGDSSYSDEAIANTTTCPTPPLPTYDLSVIIIPSAGATITGEQITCGNDCSGIYDYGTDVSLTITLNQDYIFDHWSNCSTSTNSSLTVTMYNNEICVANLIEQPSSTLTSSAVTGGSVQVTPATGLGSCGTNCTIYEEGITVNLTAVADDGFIFSGWTGSCTGTTTPYSLTLNENATCTASFTAIVPVSLTTQVIGNGSVQVTPATGSGSCGISCITYDKGTVVSLAATADEYYTFTGWTGACSGTATPYELTLNTDSTCTANFAELPKFPVSMTVTGSGTVSSNPAGIDACSDSCSSEFGQTQTVSFSTAASSGWIFRQFAGDADCVDGSLTINSAVNCTAEFAETGSVSFEIANYAGTEGDELTLTLLRQGGSAGAISVDYNALEVSAVAADYSATTGTVTWADGDSAAKTITIGLVADDLVETAETFQLNLSNVQGGAILGTQSSTEVKIFDLAAFTSLQIATARYVVNEVDGLVNVIVTRAANPRGQVAIDYATVNGTAIAGEDYTAASGTLVWSDNDSTHKVIPIQVNLDLVDDIDETFQLVLGNPQPASDKLIIGDIGQAEIQIINTPVSGAGLVQFSAPVSEANESSGATNISVSRLGGSTGAISVGYSVNGGTATAGQDYALGGNGSLAWPDGDATEKQIPIAVFADALQEGTETVTLALQNADGGAVIGAQNQALLNLIDNYSDPATTANSWVVRFTSADFNALEDQGAAVITVQREGDASVAISVAARTQNGTAIAGQDYSAVDTVLTWGVGDLTPKSFTVPVMQDNLSEGSENVTLSLYNPSPSVILANPSVANLHLLDATGNSQTVIDPNAPSSVQFESTTFRVTETQGTVAVRLVRQQNSKGLLRVPITVTLENASTNDFVNDISTVEWADGEMGVKILNIGILNDSQLEGQESFLLTLGQPNLSDAVLGAISQARVEIYDQSVVQFDAAEYSADENGGSVVLTVTRIGNALDSASVEYVTLNSTAKAGTDYQTSSGTLTWATDETDQVFSVEIRNNADKDGSRQFKVRLQNPQNANLGVPSETTVLIVDDEASVCEPPTIDCRYNNIGKTLTDVRIMPTGTVVGGTLGGTIENFGTLDGSSSPIAFLPNTIVQESGTLRGSFSTNMTTAGEDDEPARLREVTIAAGSRLGNVIISTGTILNSAVTLLSGALFDANGLIPAQIDLANILGTLGTAETDGTQAINLTTDVLLYNAANGIIGAINYNLKQDAAKNGETIIPTVSQDASTGVLTLTQGDTIGTYLPTSVTQYNYELCTTEVATASSSNAQCVPQVPFGMREQADGSIIFVTHTYRQVIAVPFMQSMRSMRSSFSAYDLNDVSWFDGIIYIQIPDSEDFCAAQAGDSLEVPFSDGLDVEYGDIALSELLNNTTAEVFFVLQQANALYARQFLYPAAAYPDVIRALSYQQQAVLHNNGLASIPLLTSSGLVTYHGLFDYAVLAGVAGLNTGRLEIKPIADVNGDGVSDYEVIYPNDARQVLYRLR